MCERFHPLERGHLARGCAASNAAKIGEVPEPDGREETIGPGECGPPPHRSRGGPDGVVADTAGWSGPRAKTEKTAG
jgi:hypothetical protein